MYKCLCCPEPNLVANDILRKIIEGYLDSVQSLTFNAIKTKYVCILLKWMFNLSQALMVKVQYMSKWFNPLC